MHIALLDADVPVPTVYSARGLYSSQFRHLLECAAERLSRHSPVHYTTFDVVGGSLPPLASLRTEPDNSGGSSDSKTPVNPLARPIDAVLITGAAAAAYDLDSHAWIRPLQSFIQTVYTDYPHVKLFGSCFGHQIIAQALLSPAFPGHDPARAFKAEAAGRDGSEHGLVSFALTPSFADRFSGRTASPLPACMRLQMVHGDWVAPVSGAKGEDGSLPLPAGWMNMGSSERCPVQGLYCPQRVLTYQGHFEFDVFVTRETVVEFGRRNGWESAAVQRYVEDIQKGREGCAEGQDDNDDSKVAAEVVMLFFAEG
ncbi:class I glutamine amidotransferase-like protein [Aspergillus ambiguus]|uniref:class I glutamine amidotransferase-like protein n=1 Tax=Aspergillus ambiguus TaxID=176160 RepID=UPI003CCCE848